MVHRGLCRELFTLRERTEKRKYSWRYETSIYFFGKKLRIEVLPDGLCGDSFVLFFGKKSYFVQKNRTWCRKGKILEVGCR